MGKEDKSENLFREYLGRHESDEGTDFESFIREHPDLEDELRGLFEQHQEDTDAVEDFLEGDQGKLPHIIDDFKIVRELGHGAMGTVYEAEQISLHRKVAVKILRPHLVLADRGAVSKFQREGEAVARLHHPGIVTIYAVGESKGVHYIAQEIIGEGTTLNTKLEELRQAGKQEPGYFREAAKLIEEIARALQHAHDSGVIHRDVKPSNILLTSEGRPKVTDFGLAKVKDALSLSRTGDFAGTPFYMSPEQAMSRRIGIDERTDIFSLGVTLYEALTLRRPFEGETSQEVLKKIILHEPRDPRKLNPRVPNDLAVICHKAMEKDPNRRFRSMDEFADDLERYLDGEVILAKPATLATRIVKRIKRRPVGTALVATVLVALLFTAVNSIWTWSRVLDEQSKTAAVNKFFVEVIKSADPDKNDTNIRVVDVLDRVAEKIDEAFPDRPEIKAMIHEVVADTYDTLGDYRNSEKHYSAAVGIWTKEKGENHQKTLATMGEKATALMYLGRFEEAKALYYRVLEVWKEDPGEKNEYTLAAMDSLAFALGETKEFDKAEALYRKVLEIRRATLPPDHDHTLRTANAYGSFLMKYKEDLEQAEPLLREAYEGRSRTLGSEHTLTLQSMNNLAVLCKRKKNYVEAEHLLRTAVAIQSRKLGKQHPDFLKAKTNLSYLLNVIKEENKKLALEQNNLVDGYIASLGESHPETQQARSNLAKTLIKLKRYSEANQILTEVMAIAKRNPKVEYTTKYHWMTSLGDIRKQEGDYTGAEELYRESWSERIRRYGEESEAALKGAHDLAALYLEMGDFLKTEELLLPAVECAQDRLSIQNPNRIKLHKCYSDCLCAQELYDEAARQMLYCYEGAVAANSMDYEEYLTSLIILFEKCGNLEKARVYKALIK